jgi:hypothetical protein
MSTLGQHNIDWLSIASFNDTFDWTKSIKTTFSTFFEYVTLHDSYWQTINLNVTNETIFSIQLDAFWNKEYTLKFDNTDNWPFLIIKIPNVLNISYNTVNYGTTIVNTSCTIIESTEIEKLIGTLTQSNIFPKDFYDRLIDCNQVNKTRFDDVYGGNIEVLHDSEILILLIDENGNYIDPSLDKVIPFEKSVKENVNNDKGFLSKLLDKLK